MSRNRLEEFMLWRGWNKTKKGSGVIYTHARSHRAIVDRKSSTMLQSRYSFDGKSYYSLIDAFIDAEISLYLNKP